MQRRRPRDSHPAGGGPARQRARAIRRSSAIWRAGWVRASSFRSTRRARFSTNCAKPRAAAMPITTASPTKRSIVRWACSGPALRSIIPARPRLFEGGVSFYPDGKCRFQVAEWRESGDPVDDGFPVFLTTGRVVSQYLSGTQTRRIGGLVDIYPEPRVEIHPQLAEQHGIADNDWVTVTTRRAESRFGRCVVRTIRPDTVFIPYHWADEKSANRLTHRTLDPRSKIPEFKVSACRIRKAAAKRATKETDS